ncbi:MAG: hypothetical protein WBP81_00040 [Solirubrobacteraceae bacterium]
MLQRGQRRAHVLDCALPEGSERESETSSGGDHRRRSFVDGVDDLGFVDAAQVGGGDPKVGVLDAG